MTSRHGVTVQEAGEALADRARLELIPDPASRSGDTVRTIGWSEGTGPLVTVITLEEDGIVYGVNGWPSNATDRRRYETAEEGEA